MNESYSLLPGASVPDCRSKLNFLGPSSLRHSSSDLWSLKSVAGAPPAPAPGSISWSLPELSRAKRSSQPPMHWPFTKMRGTVRAPVMPKRASWNAAPSPSGSSFNSITWNSAPVAPKTCFVRAQNGQVVFEKITTSCSAKSAPMRSAGPAADAMDDAKCRAAGAKGAAARAAATGTAPPASAALTDPRPLRAPPRAAAAAATRPAAATAAAAAGEAPPRPAADIASPDWPSSKGTPTRADESCGAAKVPVGTTAPTAATVAVAVATVATTRPLGRCGGEAMA
mmetsp:Transcript_85525/g.275924  ORF Transcript_85525/g.275924 Transcript_85525/m.275924 type:complete len:283 (-) Transcript_85525:27-875(-)